MKETLHILYGKVSVGSVVYDRKMDEISLSYEEAWQFGAESFPVSLSLSLARKRHTDASIRPFLQGLPKRFAKALIMMNKLSSNPVRKIPADSSESLQMEPALRA